jgi:TrmH family RNA methyltransferase
VQRLRRLVGRRTARQADRAFVVEGVKVLSEALAAGVPIESVYVAPGTDDPVIDACVTAGVRVYELAAGVLERVTDTVTPQPVLGVVPCVVVPLERLQHATFVLVLVDVRDPGNAGTVIRTAEAAGAGGVVCCDGSVDLFNPKTVRASAGAVFHVPVVSGGDAVEVLDTLGAWGLRRFGTVMRTGTDYAAADLTRAVALVLGNEAHGLPPDVTGHLDELVTVPMSGRSESLNVSMAAAVLCFETARQRRLAG